MPADTPTSPRTYKYRLLPRKAQHAGLRRTLDHARDLYNAALEERIGAYRRGISLSFMRQSLGLRPMREEPDYAAFPTAIQLWALKKLDHAYAAFFRRLRAGEKPGFPRFKGRDWFKTFGFKGAPGDGWAIKGDRLHMKGVGRVKLHLHRAMPGTPTSCKVSRDAKGWVALLTFELAPEPLAPTGRTVGVDVGLTSFIATSEGETVPGYRAARRAQAEMRRRQRAVSRCECGSGGRRKAKARVARLAQSIANGRRTFQHQLAARLIRENDLVAIEDLNVKGLSRGMLARDVHDAGWASFINLLSEKAERAGRTLVKVRPHGTSQTCPDCGTIKTKTLAERIHRCDCGCVLDRDVAAAKVILHRAITGPGVLNLEAA